VTAQKGDTLSAILLVSGIQSNGRAMLRLYNWNDDGSMSITVDKIKLELVAPRKCGVITLTKPICIESGRDVEIDITETLNSMVGDVAQTEVCVTVKGTPADAVNAKSQVFVLYQHRGHFHTFQFDRISL